MNYWKAIIQLWFLASKIIPTNSALSKGSPVKTLEDIAKGSRSQNSLHSQCEIISRKNNIPPLIDKESTVDHHIELLAKDQDITTVDINNKRKFKEAFENGESRPVKLPDNVKETNFLPQFSSDWGDDLMFFAAEWDDFPTYTMDSRSAEIQYDFANALEGSEYSYYDYYLQNNFLWSNDDVLMPQDESVGAITEGPTEGSSKEAAETQVPEHENLGKPSMPPVNLPLNSLTGTETKAGSSGISHSALLDNFGLNQLVESNEFDREVQSSNTIFENPQLFHLEEDSDNKKDLFKTKKMKMMGVKKKSFEDAIYEYELKLKDLSKSEDKKTPLSLFLEIIDKFADDESPNYDLEKKLGFKQDDLNRYNQNPFIRTFFGNFEIPIFKSQFVDLQKAYRTVNGDESEESLQMFFDMIYSQININNDESFYIRKSQIKFFFYPKNFDFKVENKILKKVLNGRSYYADQLANYLGSESNLIPWKSLSTSDNKLEIFEQREFYLKNKRISLFGVNYGVLLNQRFSLRKLFLIYSTLINKVLCNEKEDLLKHFNKNQKDAMNLFDEIVKLLEADPDEQSTYFINNQKLPLRDDIKKFFLKKTLLCFPKDRFEIKMIKRNKGKIDTLWKLLALWLAKYKYDYFTKIYFPSIVIMYNFKNFFNSLFFYIFKSN
ncbi:hypothetical protein PPACK8108_LOCUS20906 [Phakopsora pachyrhizi]|uniref:Uncharacterized protein n=1 Tax=Phakopsora pachyrhizi TaxID=170000 RepID=A0AAV0BIX8_PHAPC|nr:hypothetical protein PPACK8108_LOCUS20906 [Phakopsora pachyrhizi]